MTCPHGMPTVGSCGICMMDGPPPPLKVDPLPAPERTTTARYDGQCPGCHHTITVGDPLGLVDGDWLCERCWETCPTW